MGHFFPSNTSPCVASTPATIKSPFSTFFYKIFVLLTILSCRKCQINLSVSLIIFSKKCSRLPSNGSDPPPNNNMDPPLLLIKHIGKECGMCRQLSIDLGGARGIPFSLKWVILVSGADSRANARRWSKVGLMLGRRRRCWTNINPTLGRRLVFAGIVNLT